MSRRKSLAGTNTIEGYLSASNDGGKSMNQRFGSFNIVSGSINLFAEKSGKRLLKNQFVTKEFCFRLSTLKGMHCVDLIKTGETTASWILGWTAEEGRQSFVDAFEKYGLEAYATEGKAVDEGDCIQSQFQESNSAFVASVAVIESTDRETVGDSRDGAVVASAVTTQHIVLDPNSPNKNVARGEKTNAVIQSTSQLLDETGGRLESQPVFQVSTQSDPKFSTLLAPAVQQRAQPGTKVAQASNQLSARSGMRRKSLAGAGNANTVDGYVSASNDGGKSMGQRYASFNVISGSLTLFAEKSGKRLLKNQFVTKEFCFRLSTLKGMHCVDLIKTGETTASWILGWTAEEGRQSFVDAFEKYGLEAYATEEKAVDEGDCIQSQFQESNSAFVASVAVIESTVGDSRDGAVVESAENEIIVISAPTSLDTDVESSRVSVLSTDPEILAAPDMDLNPRLSVISMDREANMHEQSLSKPIGPPAEGQNLELGLNISNLGISINIDSTAVQFSESGLPFTGNQPEFSLDSAVGHEDASHVVGIASLAIKDKQQEQGDEDKITIANKARSTSFLSKMNLFSSVDDDHHQETSKTTTGTPSVKTADQKPLEQPRALKERRPSQLLSQYMESADAVNSKTPVKVSAADDILSASGGSLKERKAAMEAALKRVQGKVEASDDAQRQDSSPRVGGRVLSQRFNSVDVDIAPFTPINTGNPSSDGFSNVSPRSTSKGRSASILSSVHFFQHDEDDHFKVPFGPKKSHKRSISPFCPSPVEDILSHALLVLAPSPITTGTVNSIADESCVILNQDGTPIFSNYTEQLDDSIGVTAVECAVMKYVVTESINSGHLEDSIYDTITEIPAEEKSVESCGVEGSVELLSASESIKKRAFEEPAIEEATEDEPDLKVLASIADECINQDTVERLPLSELSTIDKFAKESDIATNEDDDMETQQATEFVNHPIGANYYNIEAEIPQTRIPFSFGSRNMSVPVAHDLDLAEIREPLVEDNNSSANRSVESLETRAEASIEVCGPVDSTPPEKGSSLGNIFNYVVEDGIVGHSEYKANEVEQPMQRHGIMEETLEILRKSKADAKAVAQQERQLLLERDAARIADEEAQKQERWRLKEMARLQRQAAKLEAEREAARLALEAEKRKKEEEAEAARLEEESYNQLLLQMAARGLKIPEPKLQNDHKLQESNASNVLSKLLEKRLEQQHEPTGKKTSSIIVNRTESPKQNDFPHPQEENAQQISFDQEIRFLPVVDVSAQNDAGLAELETESPHIGMMSNLNNSILPPYLRSSKSPEIFIFPNELSMPMSFSPETSSVESATLEVMISVKHVNIPAPVLLRRLRLWALTEGFLFNSATDLDKEINVALRKASDITLKDCKVDISAIEDWNQLIDALRASERAHNSDTQSVSDTTAPITIETLVQLFPRRMAHTLSSPLASCTKTIAANESIESFARMIANDLNIPVAETAVLLGDAYQSENNPHQIVLEKLTKTMRSAEEIVLFQELNITRLREKRKGLQIITPPIKDQNSPSRPGKNSSVTATTQDRWGKRREDLIRSQSIEKAELMNDIRCLRRVLDPKTHAGIMYELQHSRSIRTKLEDEIVSKGIRLDGTQDEVKQCMKRIQELEEDIMKVNVIHNQRFVDILNGLPIDDPSQEFDHSRPNTVRVLRSSPQDKNKFSVDLNATPPTINSVRYPHKLYNYSPQPQLGRGTTLVPGRMYPPSDHPLGPNSTAIVESIMHRKTLLGDSEDELKVSTGNSTRFSATLPVDRSIYTGNDHPLRLALKSEAMNSRKTFRNSEKIAPNTSQVLKGPSRFALPTGSSLLKVVHK